MEKKNLILVLCLMIIMIISGCMLFNADRDDEKNINPTGNSTINIITNGVMVKNSASRAGEGPIVVAGLPEDIDKVTVTISGDNIPAPIIYNLVEINGVWQGILNNIPAGPSTITVEAYDDTDTLTYENTIDITIENHQTLNLNITLEPVEPPPGYFISAPRIDLVNISPQQVAPNDPVILEVFAHDPENEPLTYVWTPKDVGVFDDRMSSNPTWTAPAEEGYYQLTISVIDEQYLLDHFTITIEVDDIYGDGNVAVELGTNDYPVISAIIADPTRIDLGESTTLFVDVTDPDGDALTFSWTTDVNGTFDDSTIPNPVFTVDAGADYGPCILTVLVSDGTLTSTGMIQINITAEPELNLAPVVSSAFLSSDIVSPNGVIRYIMRARDPEGTPLSFTWSNDAGTLGVQTDTLNGLDYESTIDWTAPAAGTGSYITIVTIADAEGLTKVYNFQPVTMQ